MLEIKNYNSKILHNISFCLNENENMIILGENGAGKSTLAKVLTNLISNDCVKIFDEKLSLMSSKKRIELVNYIPTKLEIFDEYITLNEFLELSFIKNTNNKKIKELLKLLSLEKLQNKTISTFSSGEKQLVLLVSALSHNARVTIFDELTANLDINRLREVFEILNSDLLKQKIIITHNLDLAYALKYKILFLKDGYIKFYGTHKDFFDEKNIKFFYNNSIKKLENHLVINL